MNQNIISKKLRLSAGSARLAGVLLALSAGIAPAAAESFTARGNEPGWIVEVSPESIVFTTMDGETLTIAPAPDAAVADGATTYSVEADGEPFSLVVTDVLCVDAMSGMPHPMTAVVNWAGREFNGCGGEPASLLHGEWLVKEIGENKPVEGTSPSIAFDPEGLLSGNGSCNRLVGSYALSGEGLSIKGLGTTMMACDQPVMEQEFALVQALEAVSRFDIDADGRLVLQTDDGRSIVAARQ